MAYEIEPTEEQRRIGQRVKQAREAERLTQAELGAAVGVTSATVSRWEDAIPPPGTRQLEKLSGALGRPLEWFLGKTEETADEVQELLVGIFRSVLRGETPVAAFERQTQQPLRLPVRDRRWLVERAQAFRDEFAQQTGRDLQSLSDRDLDALLRPFLDALRQPGAKKNGRR